MVFGEILQGVVSFFKGIAPKIKQAWKAADIYGKVGMVFTAATVAVGVKGFLEMREMLGAGQSIMANKTAAGGKIPVIYGTRRVGTQIVYMDTFGNDNRDLYVVYALAVGECEEILGRTIEIDGNSILDAKIFKKGGYIGSDKISSGAGSLCTADQGGDVNAGVGGGIGTDPTRRYQFVFNLHHGADSQTADPMLRASIPNAWSTNHKLNGICYIAAHFHYSKTGVFQGVPQITVQVKGKKVYDPRESGHTFGDPSTYEWSSNPALCYLDYITNDSYGKGLAESDINMSTFETAATKCDVEVDQPYYNGAYQSLTWSGTSGDDFIVISDNDEWYQNKTDEVFDLRDNGGSSIFTGSGRITGVQRHQFYDDDLVNKIFINETLTSTYTNEAGSARAKVKRFHCNGYIDTNKSVMDNSKELLANMRGIFSYINGKYELQIEDTGSSTFSITEDHIIGSSGLSIDYGNKDKKANKVVIEFYNSQLDYELDTATVLHDATPEYYSDDGEILEVKAQFPLITDAYIAYNMGKAILTRSRNQMSIRFLGTPEMYKLNVGDIVDITYAGLDLSTKICRVEALELQSNGLVGVSLIEYFDVYTWEVPAQEDARKLLKIPTRGAIHPPEASSIVFTDTDASPINRPTLTWTEPDDFDVKEFRVDVVDSSDNNVFSKRVNTPSVDLSFLPKASNYEASITCFNTFNVESEPVTKTFTIADDPVKTTEVEIGSETLSNIIDYGTVTGQSGNWFQINGRLDLEDRFIWNSNGDNYWALGTAGDDDVNLKIEGGANTLIQFKDQDNALGTVKLAFGDDVGGDYSHDFIHLVADYTQGEHSTDAKSIFYIKGRASDGNSSASGNIAKFTFGSADGIGFPSSVLYGTTTTPILITEDYIEIEQATAPSTTTDKLYNVSGTLYWNGGAVNTGAGDITSVTINTAGGGLTGGASFSSGDATFTLAIGSNIQGDKTFDDNVVIEGDLTVQGTTTTIDTTNLDVKDKNITLNYGTGDTSANADGAGITIQDAVNSTTDATILWTTANDTFNFSHPVSVTGNITSSNTVTSQSINVNSSGYGTIEVGGVTGAYIDLKRPNTDDFDLRLITDGTGGVIDTGSGELTLKRQGSTKIATTSSGIDVTGNISIGTDSGDPFNSNAKIKIQDSGTAYIQIKTGTSNSGGLLVGDTADDFVGGFIYNNSTNHLSLYSNDNISLELDDNYDVNVYQGALKIGGTEVITSSANLTNIGTISSGAITSTGISLFGKTVADNTTNGIRIDGTNDFVSIVRDGDLPLLLNRKTSDGTIALFRKDGLDVGVISTESGRLNIGTGDAGISFLENQDRVIPRLTSGGNADASIDLGDSASRFRNLYLSGTISSGAITSTGQFSVNTGATGTLAQFRGADTDLLNIDGDSNAITLDARNVGAFNIEMQGTNALTIDNSQNASFAGTISSGDITITGDFPRLYFVDTAGTDLDAYIVNNANGLFFGKTNTPSASNDVMALDLTNKRVGIGTSTPDGKLHIESSSSGATAAGGGDELILESSATTGLSILSGTANDGNILFGDSGNSAIGYVQYKHADNALNFGVNGGTKATIDSLGNVGIGTTSPNTLIHASANTGATLTLESTDIAIAANEVIGAIDFYSNDASGIGAASRGSISLVAEDAAGAGSILFKTSNASTASSEKVRITSAGRVGIGTTSPAQKLEVNTGSEGYVARFKGATSAVEIFAGNTGSFTGGLITTPTNIPLGFSTNTGSGSLIIDTSGNVGIGTDNPSSLDVNGNRLVVGGGSGNEGMTIFSGTTGLGTILFADGNDGSNAEYRGWMQYEHTNDSLEFATASAERMRIDSSGNVGIGTSSPSGKLDVAGVTPTLTISDTQDKSWTSSDTTLGELAFRTRDSSGIGSHNVSFIRAVNEVASSTTPSGALSFGISQANNNASEAMRISADGKVGIGTDSPAYPLDVRKNQAGYTYISSDNANTAASGTGSGFAMTESGTVAWYMRSERDGTGKFNIGNSANRMTIDSTGNVGIGTTNPSSLNSGANRLVVGGGANFEGLTVYSAVEGGIYFADGTSGSETYKGVVKYEHSNDSMQFTTNATERMRIDSSGRLLVGKTSSNSATVGVEARGTGNLLASATSNFSGFFNRLSTDGTIVEFAKDDSPVGSIGSRNGNSLFIALNNDTNNDAGITGSTANGGSILPCEITAGGILDNSISLGTSTGRFKDLYLSGTLTNDGTGGISIDTSGNVGIGTSSPNQMLELSANNGAGAINVLRFNDSDTAVAGGQTTGRIEFSENDGGDTAVSAFLEVETVATTGGGIMTFGTGTAGVTASEKMRIDSSGNVGIGTTDPNAGLQIAKGGTSVPSAGADTGSAVFGNTTSNNAYGLVVGANNAGLGYISAQRTDGTATTYNLSIQPNGGNVGIGTASPSSDLHIYENANTDATLKIQNPYSGGGSAYASTQLITNAGTAILGLNSSSRSFLAGTQGFYISSPAQMVFAPNATEAMRIDSSGNLLVGRTSNFSGAKAEIQTSDNVTTLTLNKNNANDGEILRIAKSGTTVGSIQSRAGLVSTIILDPRTNGAGLTGTQNAVEPTNGSGVNTNGALSLGGSSSRFKNLYLSSFAQVGSLDIGSTNVISASRNIDNVGTITASGNIQATSGAFKFNVDYDEFGNETASHYLGTDINDGLLLRSRAGETILYGSGENSSSIKAHRFFSGTTSTSSLGTEVFSITAGGDSTFAGTISSGVITCTSNININASGTSDTRLEVGAGTTSNHYAYIDLIGDSTYTDYGLRIIRENSGANASSGIYHRGTGNLIISANDSASILFDTNGTNALTLSNTQNATFAGDINIDSSSAIHMDFGAGGSSDIIAGTGTTVKFGGISTSDDITAQLLGFGGNATLTISDGEAELLGSYGELLNFKVSTTTVGSIGSKSEPSTNIFMETASGTSAVGFKILTASGSHYIAPSQDQGATADNQVRLGFSSNRYVELYAVDGSINTSDRNEKQDIQELSEAEQRVAVACKGLIRRYKWNHAVEQKGDDARYHFGIIAQDLQDAFATEGLDAGDYGMFISETWTDEEGNEQTRLGVRYNELLAFIIATL